MVALIELFEPQRIDGARRPKPQRVYVPAAPADDRGVVSHGYDRPVGAPYRPHLSGCDRHHLDPAAERDVVYDFRPREFPRIAEGQPVLGEFLLPPVADHLPEQPVIVADAVAEGRDPAARHALHQTGSEPAETAITERGIGFGAAHPVEIDP